MLHTASPEQLTILRRVLDEHCYSANIPADSPLREDLATRILYLFSCGITDPEALKAELTEDRYV